MAGQELKARRAPTVGSVRISFPANPGVVSGDFHFVIGSTEPVVPPTIGSEDVGVVDQTLSVIPTVDLVATARKSTEGSSVRRVITSDWKDTEVSPTDQLELFVKQYGPDLVQGGPREDFEYAERIELNNDANRKLITVVQALFEDGTSRGEANKAGVHGFSLREGIADEDEKRTLGLEAVNEIGRRWSKLFTIGDKEDDVFLSPPPEYTADLQPR